MKKINNKGFIATAVLYSLAIIISLALFLILKNFSTMRSTSLEDGNDVKEQLISYEIIYDANGGNGTALANSIVPYGKAVYLQTCPFQKTGYDCKGWSKTETGEMIVEPVKNLTQANTKITVYAFYEAQQYTLNFNANGGSVSQKSKIITYNSKYGSLPSPTRSGYNFQGWFTSPTSGKKVTANTIVTVTQDQTLHAQWKKKSYTTDGELYSWQSELHGKQSKTYNVSDYSTCKISVDASKVDTDDNPPDHHQKYGYVRLVGVNGTKVTIVGNSFDDQDGSVTITPSSYGGGFYIEARGYAGSVSYKINCS